MKFPYSSFIREEFYCRLWEDLRDREAIAYPESTNTTFEIYTEYGISYRFSTFTGSFGCVRCVSHVKLDHLRRACYEKYLKTIKRCSSGA